MVLLGDVSYHFLSTNSNTDYIHNLQCINAEQNLFYCYTGIFQNLLTRLRPDYMDNDTKGWISGECLRYDSSRFKDL